MSGYLDHLIDRAQGAAPLVKPRLPSWFEPVSTSPLPLESPPEARETRDAAPPPPPMPPASSRKSEPSTAPMTAPPTDLRSLPPSRVESTVVNHFIQPSPPTVQPVTLQREIRERHEVVVERSIERLAVSPLGNLNPQSVLTGPPQRPAETDAPPAATAPVAPVVQASRREEPAFPVAALIPKPVPTPPSAPIAPRRTDSPRQEAPATTAEDPVIRITIGRVDVRAVASRPAPPSNPRRSIAPLLSLDDYLRQKDGRSS